MTSTCKIVLPSERFRLEEMNVPEDLASALAGQAVDAEALPEAPSRDTPPRPERPSRRPAVPNRR